MSAARNFIRGFCLMHVDYATRHYSRAYDIGGNVAGALLLLSPFALCFAAGFVAGRISQ